MSTFNDNIRRQLGFGLLPGNTPEHRPAVIQSPPQTDRPARETGSMDTASTAARLTGRKIEPAVR